MLSKLPNHNELLSPTATLHDWEDLARLQLPPWRNTTRRLNAHSITVIGLLDREHAKRREEYIAIEAEKAERRRARALRDLQAYDTDIARRVDAGKQVPARWRQERDKAQLRRDAGLETTPDATGGFP